MNSIGRGASFGAALLLLTAAGCTTAPPPPPPVVAQPPAPPPPPPPPPAPVSDAVTIGNDASGTVVKLHPGQVLTVRLTGESGSTGYGWKLIAGTGHHLIKTGRTDEPTTPPPPPGQPPMVGGGSAAVFTFEARHPGVTFLQVGLYPPGRHRHVAKVFRVKVVVGHG